MKGFSEFTTPFTETGVRFLFDIVTLIFHHCENMPAVDFISCHCVTLFYFIYFLYPANDTNKIRCISRLYKTLLYFTAYALWLRYIRPIHLTGTKFSLSMQSSHYYSPQKITFKLAHILFCLSLPPMHAVLKKNKLIYLFFIYLFFFEPFIYFTSFREQDKDDINSLRWSVPVGLESTYTLM